MFRIIKKISCCKYFNISQFLSENRQLQLFNVRSMQVHPITNIEVTFFFAISKARCRESFYIFN